MMNNTTKLEEKVKNIFNNVLAFDSVTVMDGLIPIFEYSYKEDDSQIIKDGIPIKFAIMVAYSLGKGYTFQYHD